MSRPNILFIPVDDLRPQLGCFGQAQMVTPNIDRLAEHGVAFTQAYCQVPVCGATRASLLTGIRPARTRFVDFATWADQDAPGARTLPQHFREHGYTTSAIGKVFHHAPDTAERSWTRPPWLPTSTASWRNYVLSENAAHDAEGRRGPPVECADVPDSAYFDGQIADEAIRQLHAFKDSGERFFLAAGFMKPHLPFNAPRKYWDYYRRDRIDVARNPFAPEGAPASALHSWGELRSYLGVPSQGPLSEAQSRELVHGYYAATSYMDAQVGRVLDALDRLGLADNTVVVLWGDHGWQLGEHGLWCKHCNFDTSLRAPLVIRAPDAAAGRASTSLVEFCDVYPTLCDLAGLPLPDHLDGRSIADVVADPARPGKDAVFARFHAGDSIRTATHLYTEWTDDIGGVTARMLYDHRTDPDENHNIAESPSNAALVMDLHVGLRGATSRWDQRCGCS
jgi:arylsulfatase A-like enzyme